MINQKLKADLLKKLGVTPQALSGRASRLKQKRPMSSEQAYSLIAHNEGLKLDKYLEPDEIDSIGNLYDQVFGSKTSSSVISPTQNKKSTRRIVSIEFDSGLMDKEPLLTAAKISDAKKMAKIFPVLYVLENSIRVFLSKALEHFYGKNWWDVAAIKSPKNTVDIRKKNEAKNPWHQKRGVNNIDYLDFKELIELSNKVDQRLVSMGVLPKANWLKNIIEEVYESRCVICHMNPLNDESIKLIEVQFTKWTNQISTTKSLLF